jgi:hypothetical protein
LRFNPTRRAATNGAACLGDERKPMEILFDVFVLTLAIPVLIGFAVYYYLMGAICWQVLKLIGLVIFGEPKNR